MFNKFNNFNLQKIIIFYSNLSIIERGFIIFVSIIFIFFIFILTKNYFFLKNKNGKSKIRKNFINSVNSISPGSFKKFKRNSHFLIEVIVEIYENLIPDDLMLYNIFFCIKELKLDKIVLSKLNSVLKKKNLIGIKQSVILDNSTRLKLLTNLIQKRKHFSTKLFACFFLSKIGNPESIKYILNSMNEAPDWIMEKYYPLFRNFGDGFNKFIENNLGSEDKNIKKLSLYYFRFYPSEMLKYFALSQIYNDDQEIAILSAKALLDTFPDVLKGHEFIKSKNKKIQTIAFESFFKINPDIAISALSIHLSDPELHQMTVNTFKKLIQQNPSHIPVVLNYYTKESSQDIKKIFADILSGKIEYFSVKLKNKMIAPEERYLYETLISDILILGKTNEFISFINKNNDDVLDSHLIPIIKKSFLLNENIEKEFKHYCKESFLEKLDLKSKTYEIKSNRKERVRILPLFVFLALALLTFPVIFLIKNYSNVLHIEPFIIYKNFVIFYNYGFSFYSITLNSVYIVILILSFIGSRVQSGQWKYKTMPYMFQDKILPSISIIAPAYGEENTIVESISSLLNLAYPDFEVIVVNDGSKDQTLNRLIEHFDLELLEIPADQKIQTSHVLGTFKNVRFPNLTVIDKVNGGKADSLNTGINFSTKEYFCGIDADSLLESDALLKVTSQFLDYKNISIASGGNILPANGCTINKGTIENIRIPSNYIARMQTVEYLRSFMTGRIGWSLIQGLLIISGAFGVFKRKAVIEAGGYLTEKSAMNKDTVGEDMELVVRLSRTQREKNIKTRINYAFNANCWTEVPESYNVLQRQRDRWHRGLLDIITFHLKLLFNTKHSTIGMISFPYFIIFEIIGPFFEIFALIFFIAGIALGVISTDLFLLLFSATILYGVFVSMLSVFIAEKDNPIFSTRDISILLLFTILESFGYRQIINFVRITGFFNSLRQKSGWGKMTRKGFKKS